MNILICRLNLLYLLGVFLHTPSHRLARFLAIYYLPACMDSSTQPMSVCKALSPSVFRFLLKQVLAHLGLVRVFNIGVTTVCYLKTYHNLHVAIYLLLVCLSFSLDCQQLESISHANVCISRT